MNQREINRKALGRLIGQTLLNVKLALAPSGKTYHVISNKIGSSCNYQIRVVTEIDLWLEKCTSYSKWIIHMTKEGTAAPMMICQNCRSRVRHYAIKELGILK